MADTVNSLIEELSKILDRNRQQRAQAQTQDAAAGFADGLKRGTPDDGGFGKAYDNVMLDRKKQDFTNQLVKGREDANKASLASGVSSSYGGDKAYATRGTSPSAASLSPSTTAEGRVKLGQDYAHVQSLLQNNPYADRGDARAAELLKTNPYRQAPPPEPNTPTTSGMDPRITDAVSRPTQMVRMQPGGPAPAQSGEPGVMMMPEDRITAQPPQVYPEPQQPDYNLIDAYQAYQRQRGGL